MQIGLPEPMKGDTPNRPERSVLEADAVRQRYAEIRGNVIYLSVHRMFAASAGDGIPSVDVSHSGANSESHARRGVAQNGRLIQPRSHSSSRLPDAVAARLFKDLLHLVRA